MDDGDRKTRQRRRTPIFTEQMLAFIREELDTARRGARGHAVAPAEGATATAPASTSEPESAALAGPPHHDDDDAGEATGIRRRRSLPDE